MGRATRIKWLPAAKQAEDAPPTVPYPAGRAVAREREPPNEGGSGGVDTRGFIAGVGDAIRHPVRSRLYTGGGAVPYSRGHKLGYLPRAQNTAVVQMLDRGTRLRTAITGLRTDPSPWQRVR